MHTPEGPRQVDVHVAGGVITSVGNDPAPTGASTVDATGMYVLPGAIDVHVHSRDPGFPQKEDFATLTAAAPRATAVDWTTTPRPSDREPTPIAFNTAKSRRRSLVDR